MLYLTTPAAARTASDVAYTVLRSAILRGELKPGTRLVQDETARALGVSVTPVREALRELHMRGLVRVQAHTGAVVERVSPDDLFEALELRALMEPVVFRQAAAIISPQAARRLRGLADGLVTVAPDEAARIGALDTLHAEVLATASPVVANGLRRLHDVSLLGALELPAAGRDALHGTDAKFALLARAVASGQEHRAGDLASRRIKGQLNALTALRATRTPSLEVGVLAS